MIHGVVTVRKEKGMTSFGVVARMRRIFGQKKIGHTGTLDPDAEGVLPVCLGRATKLVETLMQGTKTYEAVILMGRTTDTQDTSGTVLKEAPYTGTEEEFRRVLLSFSGRQMQTPPMYSALKVNGQKLVDLARRGIEVERRPREVEFRDMELLWFDSPRAAFRVTCSHGAYIRTLCHDIGEKLGCGACMDALTRTRVGEFCIGNAMTLDEIAARKAEEDAEGAAQYSFVRTIDSFYEALPAVRIREEALQAALSGNPLKLSDLAEEEKKPAEDAEMRVYTSDGLFIGIYRRQRGRIRLEKFYYESH